MAAVPSIGRASRVEGALAPEADATRALYEQYANQVFRYCLHQLGSREEAEDAVQSTFLNAFRGIKRGVVPELEAAWLFKIAHNVCLSRRRSAWRRGRIESPTDFEVIEELTPAPSRRADELIGLQDVLERLPETQRRAILLREWQGLSYREIGAELELSQAAVETLIFRARRSLASGLEQPPQAKKRRVAQAFDWGNVLAGLKTALIGGSAAAKVAATVAVVSATTVVAAEPLQHQRHQVANLPKTHAVARVIAHATVPVQRAAVSSSTSAPVSHAPALNYRPASHRAVPASAPAQVPAIAPEAAAPPAAPALVTPAPSEPVQQAQPSKADEKAARQAGKQQGDHGRSDGHGQRKGTRTPSVSVEPQPVTPPIAVASDQTLSTATVAPVDASTPAAQDSNGHGKSKDKGGSDN